MVFEASVPTVHVWAHGLSCEPRWLLQNVKNNFTIDLPPSHKNPNNSMTNCCKICLYPEKKKSLEHNERNPTGRRPSLPPSGPTPLGPHFFWVVVCAVCAAPDSAACLVACVPAAACCCSCFCCCLCLLLLLGRRPSNPQTPPTFAVFDLPNVNNTFFIASLPPSLPHSGLLATLATLDLPKCLHCFCCFFGWFCHFLLLLDAGFSCRVLFFLLFVLLSLPRLRFCCCFWCFAFAVLCAATAFCCFCGCFFGSPTVEKATLAAFDLPIMSRTTSCMPKKTFVSCIPKSILS